MLKRKKQAEIRKVATLRALQSRGSLTPPAKVGQKRKPLSNGGHPNKNTSDTVDHLEQAKMVQKMQSPSHGIGRGLMTSQGPNANPPSTLIRVFAVRCGFGPYLAPHFAV